jgi:hypothetical protein
MTQQALLVTLYVFFERNSETIKAGSNDDWMHAVVLPGERDDSQCDVCSAGCFEGEEAKARDFGVMQGLLRRRLTMASLS